MGTVAFHTLGCRVNQYETEAMRQRFSERGFLSVPETEKADIYVINTCTVTGLADRKSRQFIRRMRRRNPEAVICATGCYVQADPEALLAIEELDLILGTNEKFRVAELAIEMQESKERQRICRVLPYEELTSFAEPGAIIAPDGKSRANVKIQDGCNRFCSYCIIPFARGPVRSRDRENILREASALVKSGFKELVLTGINTALYEDLPGLLADLDAMEGDFRIRLASLEPTVVDAPFVAELIQSERLCHHLHLSLQSGSDNVLRAMNRRYTREDYLKIVQVLRDLDPLFNITTDIIVGFPGETEEDFEDTMDLARQVGFGKIHVFPYSKRPGTAAAELKDQVPSAVKKERSQKLIELDEELTEAFAKAHEGTTRRVLAEERKDGCWVGYTDNYLRTEIRSEGGLQNTFVTGRITGSSKEGLLLVP